MTWTLRGLAGLAALGLALAGWFAWRAYAFLHFPPEEPGREKIFLIEPGQSFATVAKNLERKGLVTNAGYFAALALEKRRASQVRAGEFLLSTGFLPERVLEEITTTSGILRRAVITEGLTWWQAARVFTEAGLASAEGFREAAHNATLLARHHIPADSAEGYLYPETYMMTRPLANKAQTVVEMQLKEFFKHARQVWPDGLPEPGEVHRVVILASIVEKEAGDPSERARVAGVFVNRLKRRMPLQADPTVIYGLGPEFDGNLVKSELTDRDNLYNTYVRPGLPPGPICSPGLVSLAAAARPEAHDYLYFVARGDGTHQFSRTLDEHGRAVRKYQLHRNKKTYRSTPPKP